MEVRVAEARVGEEAHWQLYALHQRLRAVSAEEQALQQRYAVLQEERQCTKDQWDEALQKVGKAVKLKGDHNTWQVRIGERPDETVIIAPDEGGDSA